MRYLNLQKDIQGLQTDGRSFPQIIFNAALDNNTQSSITVPNTYPNWLARIQPDYYGNWFAAVNNAVVIPTSPTFVVATTEVISIYRPYEIKVKAGDTIAVYNMSGFTANCSIVLFPVNNGGTY